MDKRRSRRSQIIDTIYNTLMKARTEGTEIDTKKLVLAVCDDYDCALRTAQEYVDIATSRLDRPKLE